MSRFLSISAAAVLMASLLSSCSLKEDRGPCPCFLRFDIIDAKAVPGRADLTVVVLSDEGERRGGDTRELDVFGSDSYRMPVRRSFVNAGGITSGVNGHFEGTRYVYPVGTPADTLYHFLAPGIDATGEDADVPVTLTREFSRLTVVFTPSGEGAYPFDVRVRGNTNGIELMTGEPTEGPFSVSPYSPTPGTFTTVVPRQIDDALSVEIWSEGVHLDDILLAEYLSQVPGFSWALPDLMDVTIIVDYVRSSFFVEVEDWIVAGVFRYEI